MFIAESTSPKESYPWDRGRNYRLLRDTTEIGLIELALPSEHHRTTQIHLGDKVYTPDYKPEVNYAERIRGRYRLCAGRVPLINAVQSFVVGYPVVLHDPPRLSLRKKFWGQHFIIQQANANGLVFDKTVLGTVKQIKEFPYRAILDTRLELSDLLSSFFVWICVETWHSVMEGERDA